MNKERLLACARANRETKHVDSFDMGLYVHPCGTPGCAFGNYAAREDLQDEFKVTTNEYGAYIVRGKDDDADWLVTDIERHFDITEDQVEELFDGSGCGWADTPEQAADYIERFVERHT